MRRNLLGFRHDQCACAALAAVSRAWKEAERDLAGFFTVARLRETAWIAVSTAAEGAGEGGDRSAAVSDAFLREFLAVRKLLDRKDNQLFFR